MIQRLIILALFLHDISMTRIDNCVSLDEFTAIVRLSKKGKNTLVQAFKSTNAKKGAPHVLPGNPNIQAGADPASHEARLILNNQDNSFDDSEDALNDRFVDDYDNVPKTEISNIQLYLQGDLSHISNPYIQRVNEMKEMNWIAANEEDVEYLKNTYQIEKAGMISNNDLYNIICNEPLRDKLGEQSKVFSIRMANEKQIFMKVYEIDPKITSDLPEIDVLEQLSHGNPLYLPVYYGCVTHDIDSSTRKVAILEEKMTDDMNHTISEYSFVRSFSCHLFMPKFGDLDEITKLGLILMPILGLAALHAKGIVHLDVKPANLVHREQNDITILKLIDFGASVDISGETGEVPIEKRQSTSPYFIDPNMVGDSFTYDQLYKADAYSLGLTLIYIVYNSELIDIVNLKELRSHELLLQTESLLNAAKYRYENIKNYFDLLNKSFEDENKDREEETLHKKDLFLKFNQTLLGLIENDQNERLSVQEAADIIESIILQLRDGNLSPYLQVNSAYLFEDFYDVEERSIFNPDILIKKPFTGSAYWRKKAQTNEQESQVLGSLNKPINSNQKAVVNEKNELFKLARRGMALPLPSQFDNHMQLNHVKPRSKMNANSRVNRDFKGMAADLIYQQNKKGILEKNDDKIANHMRQYANRALQLSPIRDSEHSMLNTPTNTSMLQFGKQPARGRLPVIGQNNIQNNRNQQMNAVIPTANDFSRQQLPQIRGGQHNRLSTDARFELI